MAPTTSTPLLPNAPNTKQASTRHNLRTPTFLYPLKGIYHFARNRYLWPLLSSRLVPTILLSTLVLVTLFIWTYIPQVLFLAIFHGRQGALVNAAFLVLGEGAAVTAILFEAFCADGSMRDVFDAVLVGEGCEGLVGNARPVAEAPSDDQGLEGYGGSALSPRARLGVPHDKSAAYSPFSIRQIIEFVILLPLNLVPWIGVPLFLWLTGYRAGPLAHHRYFYLKDMGKKEKRQVVQRRRVQYTVFGCMALVLQLVPVLSMVFLLTSAAGSALWVAGIEKEEAAAAAAKTSPQDPPPEYTEYVDDPV